MPFRLSHQARADLKDIARFTIDRWGKAQAARYEAAFASAFNAIAADPFRPPSRPYEASVASIRRIAVGSHIVIYRILDDQVEIVRVLHQRMDPERHRIM